VKDGGETPRARSDGFARHLYAHRDDFDTVERLAEVAKERGLPDAQVALAWMLSKPGLTAPIIGATKLHHLEDAVAALEISLSADEIKRLEELYQPHPVLGHS
jgi:aryl-alcohol dehydrogenase-like predicted oxidoreductase